jgi:LmbE family N-acetylglucosaminyl deacetylase
MSLRLLILGAHPDDAEFHAGGLATLYRRLGHTVRMVSVTNGAAGHHRHWGQELALRRRAEAAAAGAVIGAQYVTWDFPDGALEPSLTAREAVIREIRAFRPDLVLTHRPYDYHPDHRAVGHLVRDASYMVTVPAVCPDVPILRRDPVVAYMPDRFTRPCPLRPDVVLDVGPYIETIVTMLACHESQMFEWLPFNQQCEHAVPQDAAGRRGWLRSWYLKILRPAADRFRPALVQYYGPQRGLQVEFCEAYEISEYAACPEATRLTELFPAASGGA